MFENIEPSRVIDDLEKGLGDGDLTLIVACTKCEANFELNHESVAMAIMKNTTFIEYLRWVQGSKCRNCDQMN